VVTIYHIFVSRYTPEEKTKYTFSPLITIEPKPVGDVFAVDEWDLTGSWIDDCISVYSYDPTVSQLERHYLLEDLLRFLKQESSKSIKSDTVKEPPILFGKKHDIQEKCSWTRDLIMIFHQSRVFTHRSKYYSTLCTFICQSISNNTHDVILQFPWQECTDTIGKCMCNSMASRSMHRPSLVWDRKSRNILDKVSCCIQIMLFDSWK